MKTHALASGRKKEYFQKRSFIGVSLFSNEYCEAIFYKTYF